MEIYLYNLAINTQDDRFHQCDISHKLNLIEEGLVHIQQELKKDEYKNTQNQKIRAIFVAPEYFFARSYPEYYRELIPQNRVGRHYEYKDYIEIRKSLTNFSQKFKGILIIPGTIAWKEAVVKPNAVAAPYAAAIDEETPASDPTLVSYAAAPKGNIPKFGELIAGSKLPNYEQILKETDKFLKHTYIPPTTSVATPIGAAPVPSWRKGAQLTQEEYKRHMQNIGEEPTPASWEDYKKEAPGHKVLEAHQLLRKPLSDLYGGEGMTPEQKQAIVGKIIKAGINPEEYIKALKKAKFGLAWNTAYFYLNGKKVGEYSKHSDYQEVIFAEELSVALNSVGESIVDIEKGSLKIGIEICLDHACDILKNYIESQKKEKPDIHLILSACVEFKGSQGEFLVHSSSKETFNVPQSDNSMEKKQIEFGFIFSGRINVAMVAAATPAPVGIGNSKLNMPTAGVAAAGGSSPAHTGAAAQAAKNQQAEAVQRNATPVQGR